MLVFGIDLAGPANPSDTAMACFRETPFGLEWVHGWNSGYLRTEESDTKLTDALLLKTIDEYVQSAGMDTPIIIGLDAPLSYQDGGGDRPGDRRLREFIRQQGMHHGSIMAPTFQRMVYLTLRGVQLSRTLQHRMDTLQTYQQVRICEVHPGSALIMRQPWDDRPQLREYKKDLSAYQTVAGRIDSIGLNGIPTDWLNGSSHRLDACGAALAVWHWARGRSMWLEPANLERGHPYDFAI